MNNNLEKASRIFNIIKDLHEPNTKEEICEKYTINEKTFRNYFNGKDTDIEICNVNFPVNLKRKKGHTYESSGDSSNEEEYKSSMHPIFLPLNLTEVYMLTNGLLEGLDENSPSYDLYYDIASKIYSQLSDYAKKRFPINMDLLFMK